MKPKFFKSPSAFRTWLEKNHESAAELLVGFYKVASGKPSITWPQSVDEALCFGWIDGVRRNAGQDAYTIRFTPRRARSIWSAVNIKRAAELLAEGRMSAKGRAAFEARTEERSRVYAYEQTNHDFSPEYEKRFRAAKNAWAFWQSQAPWYRRVTARFVMSAKKEETRERRLARLIDDSAHGRMLKEVPGAKPK